MHTGVCCRRVLQDFHVICFYLDTESIPFYKRSPIVNSFVMSRIFDKEKISNQLTLKVYYLLKELTVVKKKGFYKGKCS